MPQHLITLISHDISNGIQQTQHMQLQQASQAAAAPSTCRRRSQHNTQQQPGPATAAAAHHNHHHNSPASACCLPPQRISRRRTVTLPDGRKLTIGDHKEPEDLLVHMPGRAAVKLRYTKRPSLQYVLRCCAALSGKQGSQEQLHVLRRCVLVEPALHHTPANEPLVVYSTASLTGACV